MELLIYKTDYEVPSSILNFMEFYYNSQMNYLASDLLKKGLSPEQITKAVKEALVIAKSSGMERDQHFRPVFSAINKEIIKDCKLSQLAYGLVLINADPNLKVVGNFQAKVLKHYLDGTVDA